MFVTDTLRKQKQTQSLCKHYTTSIPLLHKYCDHQHQKGWAIAPSSLPVPRPNLIRKGTSIPNYYIHRYLLNSQISKTQSVDFDSNFQLMFTSIIALLCMKRSQAKGLSRRRQKQSAEY